MSTQKIHVEGIGDLDDDKIVIEISSTTDLLEEDNQYAKDAKKIAKVLVESIPGATFDELMKFLRAWNRKESTLFIDENFDRYWKKRGA